MLWWTACETASPPELTLVGPAEVRVTELGPVEVPAIVDGEGVRVLPGGGDEVVWSLSRDGVAHIEGSEVVAVGPGQVDILVEWGDASAEWSLKVELKTVVWFVDPPSRLVVGATRKLQVVAGAAGTPLDVGRVVWSSSKPDVLSVDTTGNVTAVGVGTAYITARSVVGSAMIEVEVTAD